MRMNPLVKMTDQCPTRHGRREQHKEEWSSSLTARCAALSYIKPHTWSSFNRPDSPQSMSSVKLQLHRTCIYSRPVCTRRAQFCSCDAVCACYGKEFRTRKMCVSFCFASWARGGLSCLQGVTQGEHSVCSPERWELPDLLFVFSSVVGTHWKEHDIMFSAGGNGEVSGDSVCVGERAEMAQQQGGLHS